MMARRTMPTSSARGASLLTAEDEPARVQAWRWLQLERAGFTYEQATDLLGAEVDYRAAVYLVERGCDHATAVGILV